MLYKLVHIFLRITLSACYGLKIIGRENLPESGGLILAANHTSYLDPPVMGAAVPLRHQVYFMAKAQLFNSPLFGSLISAVGAFPVKRGEPDRKAIKTALSLLKQGKWLGIFPEGTRSKDGTMLQGELGAVMLANLAQVPIVPVAITGTQKYFGTRIKAKFGNPMHLPEGKLGKPELVRYTQTLMDTISSLKSGLLPGKG